MSNEKNRIALSSVVAAVFLTTFKLIVGLMTGSLGILSEALHSGLDLVAALITLFAVRISDKPADHNHHYGHGKIENFSAFLETILLLITCVWIIYEAVNRLVSGDTHIEVTIWSYLVVIISIIIDYSRSRALYRVAKKYNSQALEADALHFSTDIWSSAVVLLGLICAGFGFYFADSVAALIVAGIVIFISVKLGKKAINVLLDHYSSEHYPVIYELLKNNTDVKYFHDLKVRTSGADTFVEVTVHLENSLSFQEAHTISEQIENAVSEKIPRTTIHVHIEPEE